MSSNTLNAEQKAEIASRLTIERFTSPNINTNNPKKDINRRIRDLATDYTIEHIQYLVDGMEETELPNKEAIQEGIEEFKEARGNAMIAALGGRRKTRRNRKGKKARKTHKGKKSQKGGKKSKKHGKKHGKKHAKKTRRHARK